MKLSVKQRKLIGFLFVSVMGTFLHFFYEIAGGSIAAALISAVNESIWEHMKLVFYPMLLYSLVEIALVSEEKAVIRCSSLTGILLALVLIPVLYYTYTGILGRSASWFNVTIFFLAAGGAYLLEYALETRLQSCRIGAAVWWGIILLITGAFTAATFFPLRIPLFRDPVNGYYGIGNRQGNEVIFEWQ